MQITSIFRPQHHATTGGQNGCRVLGQFINDRRLKIAKTILPLSLEILTDRATQALLYDVVRVEKWKLEASGELSPDGGFSCAGKTNEADLQFLK